MQSTGAGSRPEDIPSRPWRLPCRGGGGATSGETPGAQVEGRCTVGEGRAGLIGARRAFEGLVRGAQPLRSDRREFRNRVAFSYRHLTRRQKNPEPDTPPVQEDPAAGVLIAMVRTGLRQKVLDLVDRTNAHSSKPIGEGAMVTLLLEAAFQRLEAEGLETEGRALNIAETLEVLKRWVTRQKV